MTKNDKMNIAIARFMGKEGTDEFLLQNYDYLKWENLMPVVEKISRIKLLTIDGKECTNPQDVCCPRIFCIPTEDGKQIMVKFAGFYVHSDDTLIKATFEACYEVAELNSKPTIRLLKLN